MTKRLSTSFLISTKDDSRSYETTHAVCLSGRFRGQPVEFGLVPIDWLWFSPGDALVQTRGYYTMKRQKRDRNQRAFLHGYKAGIVGRSRDECPSQEVNLRENWMSGWREGRGDQWAGMTGVSGIHKNPAVMT